MGPSDRDGVQPSGDGEYRYDAKSRRKEKRKEMQLLLKSIFKPNQEGENNSIITGSTTLSSSGSTDSTSGSTDATSLSTDPSLGSTRDHDIDEIQKALNNNYANGDPEKAKELLDFLKSAIEGQLVPISHKNSYYKLQGGDNYGGVSCYLDSLLVAMFARLESFEPILYRTDFEHEYLATALRMYVNMLRSGKLLTTDITSALLDVLCGCGWLEGKKQKKNRQQDSSELFTFITDKLHMPLLTLKMDIQHGGKEDKEDDHKFIHESMLLLPVPGDTDDEPMLLEECLESYFANSIQVTRQYEEMERRKTLDSIHSAAAGSSNSGRPGSPTAENIPQLHRTFSITLESRRDSLSSTKDGTTTKTTTVELDENEEDEDDQPPTFQSSQQVGSSSSNGNDPPPYDTLPFPKVTGYEDEKKSKRKLWTENNKITLPAWMFYQLLPFYTDAQEASGKSSNSISPIVRHFANSRPVLVMCLKRYSFSPSKGGGHRNGRHVVVPETINLPSFVADESEDFGSKSFGKFKLVLESAVFHRGGLNEGHYIALVNEDPYLGYDGAPSAKKSMFKKTENDFEVKPKKPKSTGLFRSKSSKKKFIYASEPRRWLLYDDMKSPKFRPVDLETTFERECPYMLFYRMVQVDEDGYDVPFDKTSNAAGCAAQSAASAGSAAATTAATTTSLSDATTGSLEVDSVENSERSRSFASMLSDMSITEMKKVSQTTPNSPRISIDGGDDESDGRKFLRAPEMSNTGGRHSLDIPRSSSPFNSSSSTRNKDYKAKSRMSNYYDDNEFSGTQSGSSTPKRRSGLFFRKAGEKGAAETTTTSANASRSGSPFASSRRRKRDKYVEEKCLVM